MVPYFGSFQPITIKSSGRFSAYLNKKYISLIFILSCNEQNFSSSSVYSNAGKFSILPTSKYAPVRFPKD